MLKKLSSLLLVFAILSVFNVNVFADPVSESIFAPDAKAQEEVKVQAVADLVRDRARDTDQFLITITRPDEETDSTYKRSYVISGVSEEYEDVRVIIETYDEQENEYVLMENTDGESWWDVGKFGVFSKEIRLSKGANNIRILAYRTSQAIDRKDIQVNKFTVTLLNESIKDVVINSIVDFTKSLGNIFQP